MEAPISTKRLAIFAYGSLLFRPGFSFLERQRARAPGYLRSFSQASPDHRGTPERPGRVLTLAASADASTTGVVYFVEAPALGLGLPSFRTSSKALHEDLGPRLLSLGRSLIAAAPSPLFHGAIPAP